MRYKMLWWAAFRRHKGSLTGIFLLMLSVCLALGTVLTVWTNSRSYIRSEIRRAGYGNLTVWVSDVPDLAELTSEIQGIEEVERVESQELIYSDYIVNGQESDSEGQMITYDSEEKRYRFFQDDLKGYREENPVIAPGEVYISPALISMFGVQIGDEIRFSIGRSGREAVFRVQGFYEDPFMGSSMIGMKGFLIGEVDQERLREMIEGAGMNALAKEGAMLHVFTHDSSDISISDLNRQLNDKTSLPDHTEFIHSETAISGFMMILQNAFCGLMAAFVLVLLAVTMVSMGHGLRSGIDADFVNMGILKTIGLTSKMLQRVQFYQYFSVILPGMALGLVLSLPISHFVCGATLTTTGVHIPTRLPAGWYAVCGGGILLLLGLFILMKTGRIGKITPMGAIRRENGKDDACFHIQKALLLPVHGRGVYMRLAIRQLVSGKRRYISACIAAVLLVFFASLVGRMDHWLGKDGEGMMEAFNPADHDLGVQVFGNLRAEEAEKLVLSYTGITDSYLLAMPQVSVNGTNYTANVISEPERFHIMQGRTCQSDTEIVLTEFVAADLHVSVGDIITVRGSRGSGEYTVSGIYQCANDMGANIGMSREGYLKIGEDDPHLWCYHYFLDDSSMKGAITEVLETTYGGDIHVHENSWPGLAGIISAMRLLVVLMYGMVTLFTLIVTAMTGSSILASEQRDLAIYKAVGYTSTRLRLTFALRFAMMAAFGSVIGIILAALGTDPLVSSVMKLAGISNFASEPGLFRIIFPAGVVMILFTVFAFAVSGKIKRVDLMELIQEG